MPYGKKPMMMKMGSKEKNTPMNFSEKAMKYMKDMPALYGKPKMMVDTTKLSAGKRKLVEGVAKSPRMYGKPKAMGDNIIKDKKTGEARKTTDREKVVAVDKSLMKRLEKELGRKPTVAEYNKALGK